MAKKTKSKLPELSNVEALEYIISRCFKEGVPMAVNPLFDEEYTVGDSCFVFSQDILDLIAKDARVKVEKQTNHDVSIIGVKEDV